MRRADANAWLERLRSNWETRSPSGIAKLFSPHVTYQASPFLEAVTGQHEVERHWIDELVGVDGVVVEFAEPWSTAIVLQSSTGPGSSRPGSAAPTWASWCWSSLTMCAPI